MAVRAKTIKKTGVEDELQKNASAREYSVTELYAKGEMVYHKIWDDVGEVIEIGNTDDGISKMKIAFEKVGIKSLRMC